MENQEKAQRETLQIINLQAKESKQVRSLNLERNCGILLELPSIASSNQIEDPKN